jgi:hypothetical protein
MQCGIPEGPAVDDVVVTVSVLNLQALAPGALSFHIYVLCEFNGACTFVAIMLDINASLDELSMNPPEVNCRLI